MSLSLMAVPVLLDTTTQSALLFRQWVRMYHYGHQALPTLAVSTFALYLYTAFRRTRSKTQQPWGIFVTAGVVTLSMLPFTWIFMLATNNELFRLERVARSDPQVMGIDEAKGLVRHWSRLHFMRSLLPLAGAVIGMTTLYRESQAQKGKGNKN